MNNAAAVPTAPKARKPKARNIDDELAREIHAHAGGKKQDKVAASMGQVKMFVSMCKDADKDQLKMLSKSTGFDKSTLKMVGKFGSKEIKKFEKGLAQRLRKANLTAIFEQLEEHGISATYKKGKSKTLDKIMADVNGNDNSSGWSFWQILGACLAAGVVGYGLYKAYEWYTNDSSYGGGNTIDGMSGLVIDSPANVAQVR